MAESQFPAVTKPVGWWKVTDRNGAVCFFKFREDGRARMIRGKFWDWCRVQGDWEPVADDNAAFHEWADMHADPTAVWGEPGFLAARKADHERFYGTAGTP